MEKPVVIFGAGSLGRSAMEIFNSNNVLVYGFLDDDETLQGKEIDDVAVLGTTDDESFLQIVGKDCEAFVAVDENELRKSIVETLNDSRKVMPVNAIHSSAIIAKTASLGHGNLVGAGVIVGSGASIGNHCLLHSRVVVDHEAKLGNYVQVGAGANINAGVVIGDEVFIGSGVTVVSGIKIGKGARIGAGSVVVKHVEKNAVLFGNPAMEVK
ncbi:MAG: acetyltransferase [Cyclobacteriaceae bacterium]|nr:acetyltransferase [Cyclobacteriaceae bacterium]